MNILLISRCPPYPLYLGDRLIVYHLVKALSERGHTLDLLAFYDRADDVNPAVQAHYRSFFRHIHLVQDVRRTAQDYLLRVLQPHRRFPAHAQDAASPEMWSAVRQQVSSQQYDAIHLFGGVQVYEYACALGGQRALITPYESYSLYLKRQQETAHGLRSLLLMGQRRMAQAFERFMFEPYARVVVVSEADRAEILRLAPALPVEVIPNGVDLDYFRSQSTERDLHTLIFTGNFEYAPNVDAALFLAKTLLPALQQTVPDIKLMLIGNAPPPEIQELQSARIVVTGRVPDIRPYLEQAAVYVCPLRFGAGIKNKLLEALAMGCPVIATPLSVDGIHARSGEDLIVAQLDEFPLAVLKLLQNAELRHQLSLKGRALVENHHSWTQVADRYEALYRASRTLVSG